ncbi:hypothetical protein N330_14289, partial [Leptosomus discolor]
AAVDFLFPAQGHGCEDVQGLCCFNLSDHGESIHQQLRWLKEQSQKIQKDTNLFNSWLQT